MLAAPAPDSRWQLYRLLSDPVRLRVLALAAAEELSVGELAELLGESQPNVSRHAAPLRQAGLLGDRKQGTRTLVRLADEAADDAVVADAVAAGRRLCDEDGSLARVADVVRARDQRTREFFARAAERADPPGVATELPAYLFALADVAGPRELAVDAGTGDGPLLDALAPAYARVVAFDRSDAQLARARARVRARGYERVELLEAELDGAELRDAVGAGADLMVASRMLHHAPLPRAAVRLLAELTKPGGQVVIVDYERHEDERLREQQADVWMGFDAAELRAWARAAGLIDVEVRRVPRGFVGAGFDHHLGWQALIGRRPPVKHRH